MKNLMPLILAGLVACLWAMQTAAEDWPQWRGPHRDGVWSESGVVERFVDGKIPILWRAAVRAGYSGPTVSEGRVFVTDREDQSERVLCLNAANGETLWARSYEAIYRISYTDGPRASVTVDGPRIYSLGAMGRLLCLQAETGETVWDVDLNQRYAIEAELDSRMPIWGLAAAPLIYQDLVILHIGGRDGACLAALDKHTGEERWRALSDRASYTAPIVVSRGSQDVLIAWTGDSLAGLSPATGQVFWRLEFPPSRMPIGIATPVVQGDRVFVTSFYDGSLMAQLSEDGRSAKELWRRVGPDEQHTEALHSIISTPVFSGNYVYGVDSYGELRCLDADTGRRLWEDLTATPRARWSTIHFVRHQDAYWLLNERGQVIIARLTPQGYDEISRADFIEPTTGQLRQRGGVVWSHPAFANRRIYARNDRELICGDLAK